MYIKYIITNKLTTIIILLLTCIVMTNSDQREFKSGQNNEFLMYN